MKKRLILTILIALLFGACSNQNEASQKETEKQVGFVQKEEKAKKERDEQEKAEKEKGGARTKRKRRAREKGERRTGTKRKRRAWKERGWSKTTCCSSWSCRTSLRKQSSNRKYRPSPSCHRKCSWSRNKRSLNSSCWISTKCHYC